MSDDDLGDMTKLLADERVMAHYPAPLDAGRARRWIHWNVELYASQGFGLWIIETHDGTFLGDCGLTPQPVGSGTELELGYHLRPAFWGRGLATEAAAACRDLARDVLGVPRVVAIVRAANTASIRVAERVGLVRDPALTSTDPAAVVLVQDLVS